MAVNTPPPATNVNPVNLRGFVQVDSLISAQPNSVSTLGELSQLSWTYSHNISNAFSTTQPGFELVSFNCVDTVTNSQVPVGQDIANLLITIVTDSINYATANNLPFVAQNYIDYIAAQTYGSTSNIAIGQFITQAGSTTLPEWISLTFTPSGSVLKIWLCDASFQAQYDLFEIVVVPPLVPIDQFFQTITAVDLALAAVTPTSYINSIQTAKGIYPETDLQAYSFLYYPIVTGNQAVPTTWTAVIYGQAGSNLDSVKVAIQQYIAANTSHQISEWQTIFPDIYKQTEFVIIPRWDLYAIPTATTISGLYASMTNPQDDITHAVTHVPYYTASFVAQNITVMPHYYKDITLLIVNGQNNVASAATIRALFPDYIPESSNSLDFNRMTPGTQAWSNMLLNMLVTAETMTDLSSLPSGFRRIYRSNIMYLQTTLNNVDYLMEVLNEPSTSGLPSASGASGASGA